MIVNGLIIGGSVLLTALGGYGAWLWLRSEDRRDDRALRRRNPFPEPEHPGFSDIQRPPEIAHEPPRPSIHELPPLGDAVWHQLPVAPWPGDAFRAALAMNKRAEDGQAEETSPAAPPPSTHPGGAGAPAGTAAAAATPPLPPPSPEGDLWAPADTGFANWESDTYVGGLTPFRDHGDWDQPVSAPREWHIEMEAFGDDRQCWCHAGQRRRQQDQDGTS